MPLMPITKPRKKRWVHQPDEAPYPIPIETITHKPASNGHWFFYQAQMIDNNVIVQNEGDIMFLSKMGFFGKGILSRSKPEHQFFASSYQGSQRKNLPPKERRFQQQRFQQVRQHKYERHLSWQKQLSLQRRNGEEIKETKTPSTHANPMQNPSYRIPSVPAKRVKRATISERNHRAGITAAVPKRERTEESMVHESKQELIDSRQLGGDRDRALLSENVLIFAAQQLVQARSINQTHLRDIQSAMLTPAGNQHETVTMAETEKIKSLPVRSDDRVERRLEEKVPDSESSKFVFQSQVIDMQQTIGSCTPAQSCLLHPDQDQSSKPDASVKIPSIEQSEAKWETKLADWADCTEDGEVYTGDIKPNNEDLMDNSWNRTSACATSSWKTDPKDWEQDQIAESQAVSRQQGIDDQENGEPSQITECESMQSICEPDVAKEGGLLSGSYSSTSALGMDQTSIEGEKKRSSEGWTSDPRDWDIGEGDQVLGTGPQDRKNSEEEEDQGFDDSCEVPELQNSSAVVQANELQGQNDFCVSNGRVNKLRGNYNDKMEPSTSKILHTTSRWMKLEEKMYCDRLETNTQEQNQDVRKLDDVSLECCEGGKIQKPQESSNPLDSDGNHSNDDDAFVAVPTPVEFEDATTSQTESNNILSIKGRDARKKIREVKSGPVRNKDPYPISEYLQLSYEEAFFLSYGLGCLALKSTDQVQMDLTEMWRTFRRHQQSFVANYIVYHFFRSKGWVPKTGLKFGADFILYKKGPPFYHASYCVYVFMINEEDIDQQGIHKMNWASLMGKDRVIENAAKELMFCFVIKPSKLRTKDLDSPACIPHFKVQEIVMNRWVPSQGRQQGHQLEEEVT